MALMETLFTQITIMFFLMFLGGGLFKKGIISKEGAKSLGNILVYVIMPAVVLKAFFTQFTWHRLIGFVMAFAISLLALLLSMVFSALIFGKHPIENFGTSFSNAGFIGIPIVSVVFGDEAVFYASSFVALLNILQWTYGVFVLTGDKEQIALKKIVVNPVVLSLAVGVILFLIPVDVPNIVTSTVKYLAGMNAPVAMFSLGTYLAQLRMRDIFSDRVAYTSTLVRLVVIPLLTIALLTLIPRNYMLIRMSVLVVAATPVGSNVAIFAQIHNQNYTQAVKSVCLSTICSIATIPVIVWLAQWIWRYGS